MVRPWACAMITLAHSDALCFALFGHNFTQRSLRREDSLSFFLITIFYIPFSFSPCSLPPLYFLSLSSHFILSLSLFASDSMSDNCSPPTNTATAAVAPFPIVQPSWPKESSHETVLIIQHSDRVPPAYVSVFFEKQQVPYHILHIDYPGAQLPPADMKWKAIVSLGGPQGSYEEAEHPWIKSEKQFLLSHLQRSTPLLGICLGCQMLADAIGGKVYKADRMEVGYTQVELTEAGEKDEILSKLFQRLNECGLAKGKVSDAFLMHHGDTFDLPSNVPLLASTVYKQIYRIGSGVGVQFHPEASVNEISLWTSWHPDRYPPIGTTAEELVQLVDKRKSTVEVASKIFFETWWQSYGFTIIPQ